MYEDVSAVTKVLGLHGRFRLEYALADFGWNF